MEICYYPPSRVNTNYFIVDYWKEYPIPCRIDKFAAHIIYRMVQCTVASLVERGHSVHLGTSEWAGGMCTRHAPGFPPKPHPLPAYAICQAFTPSDRPGPCFPSTVTRILCSPHCTHVCPLRGVKRVDERGRRMGWSRCRQRAGRKAIM